MPNHGKSATFGISQIIFAQELMAIKLFILPPFIHECIPIGLSLIYILITHPKRRNMLGAKMINKRLRSSIN